MTVRDRNAKFLQVPYKDRGACSDKNDHGITLLLTLIIINCREVNGVND